MLNNDCPEKKMPEIQSKPAISDNNTGKPLPIVNDEAQINIEQGPITIAIREKTMNLNITGSKIKDYKVTLANGVYVITEMIKNLYIRDNKGKMKVFEKKNMIVCDLIDK